mmetsp:Transcript_102469/g.142756  ORF Transcript_102469/g.142756 Transcript_102469/m.142756 type:complete len:216 (-) Transcript_102469:9-656(-)
MLNECKCYRGIKSLQPVQLVAGPSQAQSSLRFSGPIHQVQAQAVLRLLVVLQVHADAQEVGGAGRLAALATHAVLHSRGRSHLLGCVDSGRDHLQHICGARTDAQSAANAGVVDLHCVGSPGQHRGAACHRCAGTQQGSAGNDTGQCGCRHGRSTSGEGSAWRWAGCSAQAHWNKGIRCKACDQRHCACGQQRSRHRVDWQVWGGGVFFLKKRRP